MARVVLSKLNKSFLERKGGRVNAVEDVCLEIADREFMVLVGPSGCGKSTTLRMIAGLEEVSSGEILIDGRNVNEVAPKDRDIAMVFQNYALYPHMTVWENMAFGIKLRGVPRPEIEARVKEAAGMLGLEALLERRPRELSGGQRQRVAVGRAIVRKPKVFLFDEPLSNLDAKMRVVMRSEIARLHRRLGATMIYVTHDQVEAMTMGDRICVMKDGRIQQVAAPLELYRRPANLFVAGFMGSPPMNFLQGSLRAAPDGLHFVEENAKGRAIEVRLPEGLAAKVASRAGGRLVLGVRPESLRDQETNPAAGPSSVARLQIEHVEPMGSETILHLTSGASTLVARMSPSDRYKEGDTLTLGFPETELHLFDPDTETALG